MCPEVGVVHIFHCLDGVMVGGERFVFVAVLFDRLRHPPETANVFIQYSADSVIWLCSF